MRFIYAFIVTLIISVIAFLCINASSLEGEYEIISTFDDEPKSFIQVDSQVDELAIMKVNDEIVTLEVGETHELEEGSAYKGSIELIELSDRIAVLDVDLAKTSSFYLKISFVSLISGVISAIIVLFATKD